MHALKYMACSCTVHDTQHTSTVQEASVQYTVYNIQCTIYSVQYTVYNIQCTIYSVQYTVYNKQCTIYSLQCTVLTYSDQWSGFSPCGCILDVALPILTALNSITYLCLLYSSLLSLPLRQNFHFISLGEQTGISC